MTGRGIAPGADAWHRTARRWCERAWDAVDAWERRLNEAEAEVARLRKDDRLQRSYIGDLETEVARLREQNDAREANMRDARAEVERLRARVRDLECEDAGRDLMDAEAGAVIEGLEAELARRDQDVAMHAGRWKRAEAEVERLRERAEDAESKLAAIEGGL